MIFLLIFTIVNSVTLFVLSILLARNIWLLGANMTTIEAWEVERHETLVCRAKSLGGYLDGPGGVKMKIVKHEFPYDIGIFRNIQQGMGGSVMLWLWPFAPTPGNESGLQFETNGFEGKHISPSSLRSNMVATPEEGQRLLSSSDSQLPDHSSSLIDPESDWPPPDPDRIARKTVGSRHGFTFGQDCDSNQNYIEAFQKRQREDLQRFNGGFHNRKNAIDEKSMSKEEAWQNSEGDRLGDFGVDETVELYDEDDMPIAQVLHRRRRGIAASGAIVAPAIDT